MLKTAKEFVTAKEREITTMQSDRLTQTQSKTDIDAGLKSYLTGIYAKMAAGVMVTAIVAMIVGSSPVLLNLFLGGPQAYIVMLAPLAIIWFGFRPERMTPKQLTLGFFGLATVYGISFASIAVVATQDAAFAMDVARAFFIASAMFAGVSIYGYTTKKDLGPMKSFLVMGIWGLVAASLLNLFFQNTGMSNVIAGIGILLFAGITAWQTQMMKEMYNPNLSKDNMERLGWAAALNLYISFIAMFQYVLHFLQQR